MAPVPYTTTNPARLAVFDFDGTIIDGQSGALFSLYLLRRGMLRLGHAVRLVCWGARYKLHLPLRQEVPREVIFSALRERPSEEISSIMVDFHDSVLVRRYRSSAVREVALRRDQGCVTLLVSATFLDIARRVADVLRVDGLVATDMRRDADGNYTGQVEGSVIAGPEKTRAVERWADEHVGKGCWVITCAYADHYSDIDLLGAADEAYAVCPSRTLEGEARRRGWQIVEWK